MIQPVMLPPELMRELPAQFDGARADDIESIAPSWRSEAFAEDLPGCESPDPLPRRRRPYASLLLLAAAPIGAAIAGAVFLLISRTA